MVGGVADHGQRLAHFGVLIGQFGDGNYLLTARACSAGTETSTGSRAVGAPLLAEVAALTLRALVDGPLAP